MGLGTKNRQTQTADICKQHLRVKHLDKLGLVEEFIYEFEGAGKNHDVTRWSQFTDIKDIKEEMLLRLDEHFEKWLNPLVSETVPETLAQSGASWVFTFLRPANRPDLTYAVLVSPTMASGSWTSTGVTLAEIESGSTETWQATYTPPTGTKSLFFHLQITGP